MVGVLAILGVIAAVVLIFVAADSVDDAIDEANTRIDDAETGDDQVDVGPAGGEEAADIESCTLVDEMTVSFELTNNSSKQSSYVIDANYLDDAGQRIGDEPFFVDYVRPGERSVENNFGSFPADAASCEIAEIERFAAESPNDTAEVDCQVTGVDFADDIATELVATNGSSELSDYFVDFAIVRDDVRVGSGFGSIENVKPDESTPSDGFSTADGPAEGAACEVVNVSRTSSQ